MKLDKEAVIKFFSLKRSGYKGWMVGGPCPCPERKQDHLGVIFGDKISSYRCQKCGKKGTIWELLKEFDLLHLIDKRKTSINTNVITKSFNLEDKEELDITVPTRRPPLAYRRVKFDDYLQSRGFVSQDYENYNVGISRMDPRVKNDYIVFIIEEEGECKGYVGRFKGSKEEAKAKKKLRYVNSTGTDFGKLLMGIDEVTKETKEIQLVEGVFDKRNLDFLQGLHTFAQVKCLATFSNKISAEQIEKIRLKGPNIETVSIFYDPDIINNNKRASEQLYSEYKVRYADLPSDKDAGDLTKEELFDVKNNYKTVLEYNSQKIEKKKML